MELAPFPRIEYPLEVKRTYSKVLHIGDGWGDNSNSTVTWSYRVSEHVDNDWVIVAESKPGHRPGETNSLVITFNKPAGFKSLKYSFSGGTKVDFKKLD